MAIKTALTRIGSAVALISVSVGPAYAGSCGGGTPCDLGTVSQAAKPADYGPVTVSNHTPYDYFDSIHFQRAPHVSITRIHGLPPTVGLSDAPVGFTKGCTPNSTVYCRQNGTSSSAAAPVYRPIQPPVTPAPVMRRPVIHQPVARHPVQSSRVVAVGRGYDASKFTPRVYGDPYTITPGIAHVPTSIVDRNPYRAQAVLDAGPGGITPALLGVPVRSNVPPRLPIGYPAPVVASTSVQGHHALNSVTVRPGHSQGYAQGHRLGQSYGGGPIMHPRPPVIQHPAPTVCRTPHGGKPASVGHYPGAAYRPAPPVVTTPSCGAAHATRSRY